MEEKSKVIRLSENLLSQLSNMGDISEVILKLLNEYNVTGVTIKQDENFQFFFCANNKDIPFNVTGVTKTVRVSAEAYSKLMLARTVPDESLSSVMFRLLAYTQVQKKYRLLVVTLPEDMLFDPDGSPSHFGVGCFDMKESLKEFRNMPISKNVEIEEVFMFDNIESYDKYHKMSMDEKKDFSSHFTELDKKYHFRRLPTILLTPIDSDEIIDRFEGPLSATELSEFVQLKK